MSRREAGRGVAVARWTVLFPITGVLLVAAASPASAAISGVPGETVTVGATIKIQADYPPLDPRENVLTLTEPGKPAVQVDSAPPTDPVGGGLTFDFNTQCWMPNNPCTPARNGTWTVKQTGGAQDTKTFKLRIPPAAPTEVKAEIASLQEMSVSWRRGVEPDLTGFDVFEGDQRVKQGLAVNDVCDVNRCSTLVPVEGVGERSYTVRAFRSDGAGGFAAPSPRSAPSGTLLGPLAPPAPGAPAAPPGAAPGPAPGGSAAPAPSGPPKTGNGRTRPPPSAAEQAAAQRKAFSSGFTTFAPKLGIPKLPPLPQDRAPALADGTFEPTLGFEDQILTEENAEAQTGVRGAVTGLIDSEQLAKNTAGALVLLLTGAHLRRWLSATSDD